MMYFSQFPCSITPKSALSLCLRFVPKHLQQQFLSLITSQELLQQFTLFLVTIPKGSSSIPSFFLHVSLSLAASALTGYVKSPAITSSCSSIIIALLTCIDFSFQPLIPINPSHVSNVKRVLKFLHLDSLYFCVL